jgi:hypothetical protein
MLVLLGQICLFCLSQATCFVWADLLVSLGPAAYLFWSGGLLVLFGLGCLFCFGWAACFVSVGLLVSQLM